jgi:hypothetical protein
MYIAQVPRLIIYKRLQHCCTFFTTLLGISLRLLGISPHILGKLRVLLIPFEMHSGDLYCVFGILSLYDITTLLVVLYPFSSAQANIVLIDSGKYSRVRNSLQLAKVHAAEYL